MFVGAMFTSEDDSLCLNTTLGAAAAADDDDDDCCSANYTQTHTHRFLSGCEEVKNCTSQLVAPLNFPQDHNTTLLHEFYLATQMLE